MNKERTINIDAGGTCFTHSFPEVGKEIGAVPVLRTLVENGHKLILFTMRCDHDFEPSSDHPEIIAEKGDYLTDAVNWFERHTIPLYGIQCNPTQYSWTKSPKSYAEFMIDDSAIGAPLVYNLSISDRPFVNWHKMSYLLWQKGLITDEQLNNLQLEIEAFFEEEYEVRI